MYEKRPVYILFRKEYSVQNEVKKLSTLIDMYSKELGLFEQSKTLEVYSSWTSIVGEKQAAHSKLRDIKHQTAVIETDHPGWSQQLLLNKRYIIRNFQKKYPQLEVKDISVIVSPKPTHIEKNKIDNSRSTMKNYEENKNEILDNLSNKTTTVLPFELQDTFARLRKSIIENNKKTAD